MLKFINVNLNPKKKKTCDCVTRAIATTCGITWEEACKEQYEMMLKTGFAWGDSKLENKILNKYGFKKHPQPRKADGSKYRLKELDEIIDVSNKYIYVTVPKHATCIVDGSVFDIWDCRDEVIRNYWTKES